MEKNSARLRYRHIQLNLEKGTIETGTEEITLSKNELMIFSYLLKNQGKIVTREDIMNYLWDTQEFIDDNTLTVNINRLRKRLADVGLGDCIETRRGQGYILL
ncbi:MAG TPA: winged helix-turn-helix transcriptional regulator [Candidatus Scybalousia intestinigallinarum]|nr:winged helix-turn-helix transcriptional regulator [Candidatus Scybalousia intestinigallinarum]